MICHKKAGGGAGGGRSASPAANKLEEAWLSSYHLVSMCLRLILLRVRGYDCPLDPKRLARVCTDRSICRGAVTPIPAAEKLYPTTTPTLNAWIK